MKNIRVDGLKCNFFTMHEAARINPQDVNIFIVGRVPEKISPHVKYILCSEHPERLHASQLQKLFDIWPAPMTKELLKFCYKKIALLIKSQLETSSEEQQHQKRILEMAQQDYLTGLATRWYLNEYIEHNKDEENITCIYFDLDHFKAVNDTYGHQEGDRALAATAEMMQSEFADGFAARMGGDEFMIVIPGLVDVKEIQRRVDEFMKKLCAYYSEVPTMQKLSVSAGIAQRTREAQKSIDQLIHESDQALYAAKKTGKARSEIYTSSMH